VQDDLFGWSEGPRGAPPERLVKGGAAPSKQLEDYLTGRDLEPTTAIASWARFYIHDAARTILAMPFERRSGALGRIPDHIRPSVEDEARRLHAMRKK
jgi:hypothetical protein